MTRARVAPRVRFDGKTFGRGPIVDSQGGLRSPSTPVSRVVHHCGYRAFQFLTGRRQVTDCLACMYGDFGPKMHSAFPNRAARRMTYRRKFVS
jgi:hypothetical protein